MVLTSLVWELCLVYVDNIIVFSTTLKQHMIDRQKVLKAKNHSIRVHSDKYRFCQKKTKFLGCIVCADGIKPDFDKVSAVMTFVAPCILKQLGKFLGISGYYKKFINQYVYMVMLLTNLLCKNKQYI